MDQHLFFLTLDWLFYDRRRLNSDEVTKAVPDGPQLLHRQIPVRVTQDCVHLQIQNTMK
jgi:hypothetical protein